MRTLPRDHPLLARGVSAVRWKLIVLRILLVPVLLGVQIAVLCVVMGLASIVPGADPSLVFFWGGVVLVSVAVIGAGMVNMRDQARQAEFVYEKRLRLTPLEAAARGRACFGVSGASAVRSIVVIFLDYGGLLIERAGMAPSDMRMVHFLGHLGMLVALVGEGARARDAERMARLAASWQDSTDRGGSSSGQERCARLDRATLILLDARTTTIQLQFDGQTVAEGRLLFGDALGFGWASPAAAFAELRSLVEHFGGQVIEPPASPSRIPAALPTEM